MRKYCKALTNLVIAAAIFFGIIFLVPKIIVFFAPFVAGWIIALIAGPMVRFFEEKIKLKRKIGSAFVMVAVIALVILVLYMVGAYLFEQIAGLFSALPGMLQDMEADLSSIGKNLNQLLAKLPGNFGKKLNSNAIELEAYLAEFIGKLGFPTIEAAGNFAKQLPSIFIAGIMMLLSAYFFVAERQQINEWFRKNMPATVQLRYRMIRYSLVKSVGGYLKAQLKIEIWMYFLLLFGLGILRVNYFGLIALIVAFLDFLPFLGTGTVLIPWAIIRILTAEYKTAIGLLVIWGVGQLARQLIQPKIVGDSIGVPPLPTLFLLFIGYKISGVVGMIVAVPIGLLVYSMYQDGAFETTKNSVLILFAGVNRFRRLGKEDLAEVEEMNLRNREAKQRLEEQKEKVRQEEEARLKEKKKERKSKQKESKR